MINAVLVAAGVATIVAGLICYLGGELWKTGVRWILLAILNLTPGNIGIWRKKFSPRETAFAAWFLTFIATLALMLFVEAHRHLL